MYSGTVYNMRYEYVDGLPWIDPGKQKIGWADWDEIQRATTDIRHIPDCDQLAFTVRHPRATEWDCYPNWSGQGFVILSQRAMDCFSGMWGPYFAYLRTRINDTPYYLILPSSEKLACVDIVSSVGTLSNYLPNFLEDFICLRFLRERLSDPLIFVPREANLLLVTESVRQRVVEANLRGFEFIDCDNLRL